MSGTGTGNPIATGARLTIDHRAGGRGRETAALDEAGRAVVRVKGDWAILDAEGRWTLFNTPEYLAIARSSIIDGLIGGLLGGTPSVPSAQGRNAGPGHQTVRRALLLAKGPSPRAAAMAAVDRDPAPDRAPGTYSVTRQDGGEAGMAFHPVADPGATTASTGFADPRYAVYELRHADGRPVIRHTARIGKDLNLVASTFEVLDPEFPLDEAVILSLARFHAWRS